jgi:very-short-patch-repair endonuclease
MRRRQKSGTIQRARQLRRDRTDAEGLLWWKLRQLNALGFHFRRQVPVRGYFLDFAEHGARLALELDGSQHGTTEHHKRDEVRDHAIAKEGYLVLRFWNGDVLRDLDGTVEVILREVERRSPPTRPAPPMASPGDLPTRGR